MSQQLGLSSAGRVSVPAYTGWTHSYFPSADDLIHMSGSGLVLGRDNWVMSHFNSVQCSSVPKSRPTLCDPMDCSMPGFPIHHQLPELTQTLVHGVCDAIQPSHHLSSASTAFNIPQHQGLFQWVSSSHQVTKVLEFQHQHQFFQWIFRTDFLYDWLVGSPCNPRDSQEFSPTSQFKSINSLVLTFFIVQFSQPYGTTGKNHSFD